MTDTNKALTELPRPVKPAGGLRATLALLLSLVALAGAGYSVMQLQGMGGNTGSKYDVLASDIDGLRNRLDDYANKHGLIIKELANLSDEMQAVQKQGALQPPQGPDVNNAGAGEDNSASQKEMETRLAEIEDTLARQKDEVADTIKSKSHALALLARIQAVRYKLQQGLSYAADLKRISQLTADDQAALHTLAATQSDEGLSDQVLLQGLSPLATAFLAREKMQKADGVLDKVGIQLEKLVVIRAKDGHEAAQSPLARMMDELRKAIAAEEWGTVKKITDELKADPVKDFDSWYKPLLRRMDSENALTILEDGAVAAFESPGAKRVVHEPAAPVTAEPAKQEKGQP